MLGQSFVTAAALSRFQSTGSTVGAFTVTLLAAQAIGNFGLGALSDRWGHKFVLVLSGFLGAMSLVLAVFAPTEAWFYPIFVLGGISLGGYQLSGFTMVMSFASTAMRPTYIATANTFYAPISAVSPILAGWMAGMFGYGGLFVVLAVLGLMGVVLMHYRVHLPSRGA
jgi:MFS family permease